MPHSRTDLRPTRGEIWTIRFDPIEGAEIDKTRPAIVVNPGSVGRLPLRIVVPVTGWSTKYAAIPWLVYLKVTEKNHLRKESAADCFQVKSVSLQRFVAKVGDVRADEIQEISAAIALCVGA
jgi:mRNA interferase MazF